MSRIVTYTRLLRDIVLMPILLVFPKDKNKILFGAWFGRQVVGSPKYMLKYILERQAEFECVWVGEESVRDLFRRTFPQVKFVRKGTWSALWQFLRSRFVICNVDLSSDIIHFPHFHRIVLINTTHGGVNKRCGVTMFQGNGKQGASHVPTNVVRKFFFNILSRFGSFAYGNNGSWGSTSSVVQRDLILGTYPSRYSEETLLTQGSPCIDFLVNNNDNAALKTQLKEKYAKLFGIPSDKRWYIYVPTWRHAKGVPFTFAISSRKREYDSLLSEQNAILIDKQHPKTLEANKILGGLHGNVYVVSPKMSIDIDIQELLLVCDRLISDYSTIYFDYSVLHRPVIEFTFDYDFVASTDFGLEYDLREYAPGYFAYTEDELLSLLSKSDEELIKGRKDAFLKHIDCERGHACEALLNVIREHS